MDINTLRGRLSAAGQEQVLRFADRLPPAGRDKLASQLTALDLNLIPTLADEYVRRKPELHLPKEIRPVEIYPRVPGEKHRQLYRDAEARGRELLKAGKVGAFLVAGGQ